MAELGTHLVTERASLVTLRLPLARPSSIPTSLDLRASTDACLRAPRVRMTMERNFASFPTLDTGLAWAESRKRDWLERGWSERNPDPNEG